MCLCGRARAFIHTHEHAHSPAHTRVALTSAFILSNYSTHRNHPKGEQRQHKLQTAPGKRRLNSGNGVGQKRCSTSPSPSPPTCRHIARVSVSGDLPHLFRSTRWCVQKLWLHLDASRLGLCKGPGHMHASTPACTHTLTHTNTRTHARSLARSLALSLPPSLARSLSLSRSLSRSLARSLSLAFALGLALGTGSCTFM